MAFLDSMNIAASGLTASRMRMDVISENIANAETTRTEGGGPYTRKATVYEAVNSGAGSSFDSMLANKLGSDYTLLQDKFGVFGEVTGGVTVTEVIDDESEYLTVYDPDHPDADENGYVQYPNVDTTQEVLDMMAVTRAYQMNLNALDAVKTMATQALRIGGQ